MFEKTHRVIALDYRGHHRSGSPRNGRNMTIKWCARDVEDLMNHLKLSRAVCLGHSFRLRCAFILLISVRRRVAGLVLICGSVVRL
ncbi:MAG: alpha/beta fold hydrolase [Bdellovibrionota bacterium]